MPKFVQLKAIFLNTSSAMPQSQYFVEQKAISKNMLFSF